MQEQAVSELEKSIDDDILKNQYSNTFYHYTSIAGFYNIMKSQELWLGNAASMNDRSEITYFLNELKNALLNDLPQKKTQCNDFFAKVFERLENEYPYIFSLTELEDNAGQWERYGDGAKGICIVFNAKKILKIFYEPVEDAKNNGYYKFTMLINRVFYGGDVRKHAYYKLLKNYFLTGNMEDEAGEISNLLGCAYMIKHKSFMGENEVRISTLWNRYPQNVEIEAECVNGKIKTFMKMNMKTQCAKHNMKFEDLIGKIIIGPKSMQTKGDLKMFLKQIEMKELSKRIEYSKCPLR